MFERFSESAMQVMTLAGEEADRLRHDYIGPEHVLAGLARLTGSRATRILRASGLTGEAVSAALDTQVAAGLLPAPWRNQADLLRSLGIDISQVRQATEVAFGPEAVQAAIRQPAGHTWLGRRRAACVSPLGGKAMLAKGACHFAVEEADRAGQPDVQPEQLLLGVLRDAKQHGKARSGQKLRQVRVHVGLPESGVAAVSLIVEAAGSSLDALRAKVVTEMRATG